MSVTDLNFQKTSKMLIFRLFLKENHEHRETCLCSIEAFKLGQRLSPCGAQHYYAALAKKKGFLPG